MKVRVYQMELDHDAQFAVHIHWNYECEDYSGTIWCGRIQRDQQTGYGSPLEVIQDIHPDTFMFRKTQDNCDHEWITVSEDETLRIDECVICRVGRVDPKEDES